MGKIVASLARILAKMIGKSGQPIIGIKVDPPTGWADYCKRNPEDKQC